MAVFQGLVRVLDGKTANLRFTASKISGKCIKEHLFDLTDVPPHHQRLVTGTQQISEETLIEASTDGFFPTIHLLLRLPGGKGGFGSLLRGAATKAGQKKTKNNDACRDMSGRRLRHVNAEKKLEAWNAEAEERKLEKIAEDFIKKKAKEMKKSGSGDSADKYLEKYREDSRMCMEKVEASVRESLRRAEDLKRKVVSALGTKSKRLKMLHDSDSDDEDESSDEEDQEQSVVLDDRKHSVENRDGEGCSTSFSNGQSDGESSGGGSAQSNLEEENSLIIHPEVQESEGVYDAREASTTEELVHSNGDSLPQSESISSLQVVQGSDGVVIHVEEKGSVELVEEKGSTELKSCAIEQVVVVPSENNVEQGKPLDFNEYNSATEMEVLGMERLKNELQAHGLKCGGTLQERAARLFLLKTTPLEKLPKKLLAKK